MKTPVLLKNVKKKCLSRRQRKNVKIYINLTLHNSFLLLLAYTIVCVFLMLPEETTAKKENLNLFHSLEGVIVHLSNL